MPSGAKKRKAAKNKKLSTTNPHHGENRSVEVEKREDSSSENKSKDVSEGEGNIEIESGSKSKSSNGSSSSSSDSSDDESRVVEKNVVVLESTPIESVPVTESSPEEIPPIVDPVTPVDSLLEQVSQVFDEITSTATNTTPVTVEEQRVVLSEIASKDDCPSSSEVVESGLEENEVIKLPLSESENYVESSTSPNDPISEVNGAECENETVTVGHSDRQVPVDSTPLSVQKTTSWKSCCGLFELFSGSGR